MSRSRMEPLFLGALLLLPYRDCTSITSTVRTGEHRVALFIDTASREPIYLQIVQQVREQIARGELRPEERLPSVRQLSQDLVVNPNTIARAYTELEREGTLVSRAG